jgi:hypothetical protein
MTTNFGFNSGSGLTSGTGSSVFPSIKRVRISDAAGAEGLSLLSGASSGSEYKLRTVQGVDGVVTTVAGDNIQMSASELSSKISQLNVLVSKKAQKIDLYESEVALVPASLSFNGAEFSMDKELQLVTEFGSMKLSSSVRTLQSDLKAQVDQEKSDVSALNILIPEEKFRAVAAETKIDARITTEIKRASDVEGMIYSALAAETNARSDFDTNITTLLSTETATRQSADSKLTNDLAFETSRALAAEALLNTSLNAEIKRATDADTKYAADLNAEVTRAASRESVLEALIITEQSSRFAADSKLTTDLNAEITSRIAGVNAVTSDLKTKYDAIDTAFGNFVAVATSRDEYLNQKCDFIMKNVDPAAIDSLSELVNRQNSVALGVYSRLQMLEDILSTLIGHPIYEPGERPEVLAPMVGPTMDPVSPPPAAMP